MSNNKNRTTDDLQEILEVLNDLKGDDYKNNIDEIKERIRKATLLSKYVADKEMSTEDFLENPLNIIDSIQFRSNADKIKELIDNDEIISWDSIDEGNSFSNIFLYDLKVFKDKQSKIDGINILSFLKVFFKIDFIPLL